jgi:hypothetical protein
LSVGIGRANYKKVYAVRELAHIEQCDVKGFFAKCQIGNAPRQLL